MVEMCKAFTTKPLPKWKDYRGCFEIDEFRVEVATVMAGRANGRESKATVPGRGVEESDAE